MIVYAENVSEKINEICSVISLMKLCLFEADDWKLA